MNIKPCRDDAEKVLVSDEISRREALGKAGRYAALTSATMLMVLSPKAEAAPSPIGEPIPWPDHEEWD